MALPPPIPLRPDDRPETWDEYVARRQSIALWRGIGDFVTGGKLSEFLFAPYKSSGLFAPYEGRPIRRHFATLGDVLIGKPVFVDKDIVWPDSTRVRALLDDVVDRGDPKAG